MFPQYLQYQLMYFYQTLCACHWCILGQLLSNYILGQKVKGQGHIIASEASNTQCCRRFQVSSLVASLCVCISCCAATGQNNECNV